MERVTVNVERSEHVRLEARNGLVFAVGDTLFSGVGETPSEALADYRRKLQAETSGFVDRLSTMQRYGSGSRSPAPPPP